MIDRNLHYALNLVLNRIFGSKDLGVDFIDFPQSTVRVVVFPEPVGPVTMNIRWVSHCSTNSAFHISEVQGYPGLN